MSPPPFDTLNLAGGLGDDTARVVENRRRAAARFGLPAPDGWWWLRQVHGPGIVTAHGAPSPTPPAADGAVTSVPGLPLVVLTADCAPVVLASDDATGVVHAGWVGLLAGVLEEAVSALRRIGHGQVQAFLGPCIRADRYEFGREDLARLVAVLGTEVEGRTASGEPALDVPAAVRVALARAGVTELTDSGVCTAGSSTCFSHRRDGPTGRQAMIAVLDP